MVFMKFNIFAAKNFEGETFLHEARCDLLTAIVFLVEFQTSY